MICKYCEGTGKLGFQRETCCFCDGTGFENIEKKENKNKLLQEKFEVTYKLNLTKEQINLLEKYMKKIHIE